MNIVNDVSNVSGTVLLQTAPGEYLEFSLVDNKGLYPDFYRTTNSFSSEITMNLTAAYPSYAIYKKVGYYSILVCAFANKEEINEEAMSLINSNEKYLEILSNLLEGRW